MKYKIGDRVRIKSLDWYNENKNHCGEIPLFNPSGLFVPDMSRYCNNIMTIKDICYGTCYRMKEDIWGYNWTDEMIEGLVEEKTKVGTALNPIELKSNANCLTREKVDEIKPEPKFKVGDVVYSRAWQRNVVIQEILPDSFYRVGDLFSTWRFKAHEDTLGEEIIKPILLNKPIGEYILPDGYIFKDENGNVINATKIVLEKKKKEYPKTLKECRRILDIDSGCLLVSYDLELWKDELLSSLQKLLICRDAYWELYGEEMGLGKPWEPDYNSLKTKYTIEVIENKVVVISTISENHILAFPTEEMRDVFYENFKELIEQCKELL